MTRKVSLCLNFKRNPSTNLDGVVAEVDGQLDGLQHALVASPPRHVLEAVLPQRVQADVD